MSVRPGSRTLAVVRVVNRYDARLGMQGDGHEARDRRPACAEGGSWPRGGNIGSGRGGAQAADCSHGGGRYAPCCARAQRRALEAAIKGGDADSSAHRRALRDAVQKARKKAMGHSPRGHQERLMARFPDLGPFVIALVTQMGGRATERRDSDQICIKSTYRVIASIVSARFGVCISARWLCKHSRKHAQRSHPHKPAASPFCTCAPSERTERAN